MNHFSRRKLVKLGGIAVASSAVGVTNMDAASPATTSLFDARTLDGWVQIENSSWSLSAAGISDPQALVRKLRSGSDPVSAFLRGHLSDSRRADLASYSPSNADAKDVISALVKDLNQIVAEQHLSQDGQPESGRRLAHQNRLLLEQTFPNELTKSASTGWVVKEGAMASTGAGRGVVYTVSDYSRFRLMFTMRHVSGDPDHQACVLIFCSRPRPDALPLDALGGIQFQVPNGGHWDYRVGMNNNGGQEFTSLTKTHFDVHAWSRVEILADAARGTARMAVAQPPGSKAVEVLAFEDARAGKSGPIAWQMHNAGLFDEYKDVEIERDPKDDDLITVK